MDRESLELKYLAGSSMKEIADELGCSVHRVQYWMDKFGIQRRGISDAIYIKHNPGGDPFDIKAIESIDEAKLMGIGIGLFWGEGNKRDRHTVRLGNTDPALIQTFIRFLTEICCVKKEKIKFSLQIFSDTSPEIALNFWCDRLKVDPSQFYKITVTISGSIGTYRSKSKYGVLQLYVHNKKLRDHMIELLPT